MLSGPSPPPELVRIPGEKGAPAIQLVEEPESVAIAIFRAWRRVITETVLGTGFITLGAIEMIAPKLMDVVSTDKAPLMIGVGAGLMGVGALVKLLRKALL